MDAKQLHSFLITLRGIMTEELEKNPTQTLYEFTVLYDGIINMSAENLKKERLEMLYEHLNLLTGIGKKK